MYEVLNSFKQKPIPNFNKHSLILKTPKISKTPKPRFQNMKMHKNERIEAYQVKKTWLISKNAWGRC